MLPPASAKVAICGLGIRACRGAARSSIKNSNSDTTWDNVMTEDATRHKFSFIVSLYDLSVLSLIAFFYFDYIRYLDESPAAYFSAASHYVAGAFILVVFNQILYRKSLIPKIIVPIVGCFAFFLIYMDSSLYRIMGIHINGYVLASLMHEDALTHIGIKIDEGALSFAYPVIIGLLPFVFYKVLIRKRIEIKKWLSLSLTVLILFISDKVLYAYSYYAGKPYVFSISDTLPAYITIHPYYSNKVINILTGKKRHAFAEPSYSASKALDRETLYSPICKKKPVIKNRLNVLVVIAESLRFNEITADVAPNIRGLGSKGLFFLNHYSSSNTTHFAVFSLLYGLNPYYFQYARSNRIPPLLSKVLSENGYELAAVLSRTMKWYDLDKSAFANFDRYTAPNDLPAWKADEWVVERTMDIVRSQKNRDPVFMVSYLYSTHFDYQHPDGWAKFVPEMSGNIRVADSELYRNREALLNRYRNSVSYVDFLIGKMMDGLVEAGLVKNTIIIITGDHGEELFEEGHLGHNSRFNDYQIHVPMIVMVPGIVPRSIDNLTSHIDVPKTILSLLAGNAAARSCALQGIDMINDRQDRIIVAMAHYRSPRKYAILDDRSGMKIVIGMERRLPVVERVTTFDGSPVTFDRKKYSSEIWRLLEWLKVPG